jgi:hypothetical protein
MDTKQVAEELGTTSRILRVFLRSDHSTFVPVGSGSRYEFTERELPTLRKRFADWNRDGKPRPAQAKSDSDKTKTPSVAPDVQALQDSQVWAEEERLRMQQNKPTIAEELGDIRDPRVRDRALSDARAAEERLNLRLLAAGLHITQLGDKK